MPIIFASSVCNLILQGWAKGAKPGDGDRPKLRQNNGNRLRRRSGKVLSSTGAPNRHNPWPVLR